MTTSGKYRISTRFISLKVFLVICIIFSIYILINTDHETNLSISLETFLFIMVISLLLYHLQTINDIEFNGIDSIYKVDKSGKVIAQIPLENIDKILFSAFGLNLVNGWNYSYRIIYRDKDSKIKKLRIFPRTGGSDIVNIIRMTRKCNPNVEVSNWSYGLNEFID